MIKSIEVKKGSIEEEILLFNKIDNIQKFNVLFGGNGVGKTTLLNAIKSVNLDMEFTGDTQIIKYVNSEDNMRKIGESLDHFYKGNKVELTKEDAFMRYHANHLSEGQSIIYSLVRFLEYVEEILENSNDDIVLLFDEVDSGLSCENINMFIHFLLELTKKYKDRNIQFFISSNNYHFAYVTKVVLNMYTGKYEKIENYEEYFQKLADNMVNLGKKRDLNFL